MAASRIRAVVGLGNPGDRYRATRHNVGFDLVDLLAEAYGGSFKRSWRLRARSCKIEVSGRTIQLVKPQGFMNRSGETLVRLNRRGVAPSEMVVVVDDVDQPPGNLRLRERGGAGGHNGLKSILEELGTDAFPRLRIGVGAKPPGTELSDHVLGRFRPEERTAVDTAIAEAKNMIECALDEDVKAAMNRYNSRKREKSLEETK